MGESLTFEHGKNHQKTMWVKASGARVKGQMTSLNNSSSGFTDVVIPVNGTVHRPIVWLDSCASGSRGLVCVEGACQILIKEAVTAGNGIKADNSLAGAGDSGGGVVLIAGNASTTCGVWMETNATADTLAWGNLDPGFNTAVT